LKRASIGKKYTFKARIYKTGINWCVDVPGRITMKMVAVKGYIKIKGRINGFNFTKSLVPVKDSPYRLFVNQMMMKGGNTALGKVAVFDIEQDKSKGTKEYTIPKMLIDYLNKNKLAHEFEKLTASRKKDITKYLSTLKSEAALHKNVQKVISQLKKKEINVRVP
jgi:hypothetical protein